MTKRFVAYADIFKGKLRSLALAEFDMDKLLDDEKEAIWDNEKGDEIEYFIDNIRPYYYHYGIDFNDPNPVIFINEKDPANELWPANASDVYKTLETARKALIEQLESETIEKRNN